MDVIILEKHADRHTGERQCRGNGNVDAADKHDAEHAESHHHHDRVIFDHIHHGLK